MKVEPITYNECKEWLLYKHYAKRLCSVSFAFGLYQDNVLEGVCTFGKPASPCLCVGVCGKLNSKYVYELNRLCVNDDLPKNTLSFFVAQCLKKLPNLIIVSYADTNQNHIGYIYQATNFLYTGLSAKRTERYDAANPNKYTKRLSKDFKIRERPRKHRYIFFTGSKKQKKFFKKELRYKLLPYPKGNTIKYDCSYKVSPQLRLL